MKAEIREKYVLELNKEEASYVYQALLKLKDRFSDKGKQKDTDIFLDICDIIDNLPDDWPL